MDRAERGDGIYVRLARFGRERQPYIASILAEIEARGGLGAGELDGAGRAEGGWWGWSEGKHAVEWLFWSGRITTATRRGFERIYDLTDRKSTRLNSSH